MRCGYLHAPVSQLEVTDTAGAEQFTALNEFYIKSADGFILVFRCVVKSLSQPCALYADSQQPSSLTQETSLREIETLRQQIYRVKGTKVPIVVVGTKSDLVAEREVQRSYIQELSSTWKLPFYETSAKRNWHVDDVFEDLVRQMRSAYPEEKKVRKVGRRGICVIS